MMFFVSRQKKVEAKMVRYCDQVAECLDTFHQAMIVYCDHQDHQRLREDCRNVHHAESAADDIRREIEDDMYSKSIFPESRGDILKLIEAIDKIPNQAEEVLRMSMTHIIKIPPEFAAAILQLTELCRRCVSALLDGTNRLFEHFNEAAITVGKVDELESQADVMQFDLYERIFAGELDPLDKLLLRDLVKGIASISDYAENAGDHIRIIIAKRSG